MIVDSGSGYRPLPPPHILSLAIIVNYRSIPRKNGASI